MHTHLPPTVHRVDVMQLSRCRVLRPQRSQSVAMDAPASSTGRSPPGRRLGTGAAQRGLDGWNPARQDTPTHPCWSKNATSTDFVAWQEARTIWFYRFRVSRTLLSQPRTGASRLPSTVTKTSRIAPTIAC